MTDRTTTIVYRVVCLATGKLYFGVTRCSLRRRRSKHYNSASSGSHGVFHKALRKYAEDMFVWEVVAEFDERQLAYAREVELIAKYRSNSVEGGYNRTAGGEGALGHKHSPRTKQRLSSMVRDWFASDPSRAESVRARRIGKPIPLSVREKMSLARRGQKRSAVSCARISEAKRKKYSDIRAEVIDFARVYGPTAAAKRYSIDRHTVRRWMSDA